MEIRKLTQAQRSDLILQLNATRRVIERDIADTRRKMKDCQKILDGLLARMEDVEHSLGNLR